MITAICDDNPLHLKKVHRLAQDYLEAHQVNGRILSFSGPEALLTALEGDELQPDLAILDIEMPGENGISLAKKLNRLVPGCRIIFLTAYIDYAPEAYEADHLWFVIKNRADEFFAPAMNKALESLAKRNIAPPGLLIREEGRTIFLPLDSVLYLTKVGRKALIHCTDGDHSDPRRPALLIPPAIADHFLPCHQGYWVNLQRIRELDHETFVMDDGSRIPISRTFRKSARKIFFDHLAPAVPGVQEHP